MKIEAASPMVTVAISQQSRAFEYALCDARSVETTTTA